VTKDLGPGIGRLMILSMKTTVPLVFLACFPIAVPAKAAVAGSPQTDIVVVGAGISGLCAALEGARRGASVTVIDMGSIFGGHSVMSSGMVCMGALREGGARQAAVVARIDRTSHRTSHRTSRNRRSPILRRAPQGERNPNAGQREAPRNVPRQLPQAAHGQRLAGNDNSRQPPKSVAALPNDG